MKYGRSVQMFYIFIKNNVKQRHLH